MTVLILEDDARLRSELAEFLRGRNLSVLETDRPSAAHLELAGAVVDVALIDVRLPEYDGLRFLGELRERHPDTEAIVMSGHGDMDDVIEALRLGAFDYLRKPFTPAEIEAAIIRTGRYMEASRDRSRLGRVCAALRDRLAVEEGTRIVGPSAPMRGLLDVVDRAAAHSESPVLIVGESGTGKELVARRIHEASARADGPFVAVNCAAVSGELFESEFFGHVRGAFTDAKTERPGFFRRAHGGTLFLDEIGELELAHQSKLLRVIEDGKVRRVGADNEERVDVRIVTATNRRPDELVSGNALRRDLYYRLAVIEVLVPPLRERPQDIPALVEHFLELLARSMGRSQLTLPAEWVDALRTLPFPGNVRELRNLVERAVILGPEPARSLAAGAPSQDIVPRPFEAGARATAPPAADSLDLAKLEAAAVRTALEQAGENRSAAARLLGISRQALERRLLKLALPQAGR